MPAVGDSLSSCIARDQAAALRISDFSLNGQEVEFYHHFS